MLARERFEEARDAARDLERVAGIRTALESRSSLSGGARWGTKVSGGGMRDPTAAIDSKLDAMPGLEEREADDRALVEEARAILYGAGGVADGLGQAYADSVSLHYLALFKWDAVAATLGCSESWARTMAVVAFDWLDSRPELAEAGGE